ncbi:MAG: VOC family protein [Neisseria sp.]|nr:VOC family protein [Neisseria sp.]
MKLHHIALICSDYPKAKAFYTETLGLEILAEHYRAERQSYKLDLALNGQYLLELFSFPEPPPRPTRPEACGLRHLAFAVDDIAAEHRRLLAAGIACETVRTDEYTGKTFFFFPDPDGLPIEFYQI